MQHFIKPDRSSVSHVADWLAIEKQNPVFAFTPAPTAPVPEVCCKLARKDSYLLNTDSAHSKDAAPWDFEEKHRLSWQTLQYRQSSSTSHCRKKGPQYPDSRSIGSPTRCKLMPSQNVLIHRKIFFNMLLVVGHAKVAIASKLWQYSYLFITSLGRIVL